ncbi:DNA annealing helicase and endonuclease ZRANB3 [Smittium mucronatum]|uniref:DNA annealing helicase and endonuclease ZRANB3 n=1 Tax=Smittium mucronatum TaxID=133383 RepID=A0A1R0H0X6_9FUNG|nr:DNA annealing helicase and endonuclease ZRANB3 [Smittium mucronatum]
MKKYRPADLVQYIGKPPWGEDFLVPIVFYVIVYPQAVKKRVLTECSGNVMRDTVGQIVAKNLLRGPRAYCLCRYCGKETDSYYQTFCNRNCVLEFQVRTKAQHVRTNLLERDGGVCQLCGFPAHQWYKKISTSNYSQAMELLDTIEREQSPLWKKKTGSTRNINNWTRHGTHEYCKLFNSGMFWEAAHIRDVADGGGVCGLEGYRILCVPCHERESMNRIVMKAQSRNAMASSSPQNKISPAATLKSELPDFISSHHLENFRQYVKFIKSERQSIALKLSSLLDPTETLDFDTIVSNISDVDETVLEPVPTTETNSEPVPARLQGTESELSSFWTLEDKLDLIKLTSQYGKRWSVLHQSYFTQFTPNKLLWKYNSMLKSGEFHKLLSSVSDNTLSDPHRFNHQLLISQTADLSDYPLHPRKRKLIPDPSRPDTDTDTDAEPKPKTKPKFKNPWTDQETEALIQGFNALGSKWAEIKKMFSQQLSNRSNVDIKDRFRVLRKNNLHLAK